MIRYVFRDGPITFKNAANADPQAIGEALAAITRDAGGELQPQRVWQTAKADKSNPLHSLYDWDVQRAAEAHWTEQSRGIIQCIRIVNEDTQEPERAFFSVADKGGTSYRTLDTVRSSTDLQIAVLKQAERDLDAWERRYKEISDACKLVRSARSKVRKRRELMETRPT